MCVCVFGHLEGLKLSVATEITMMELHYVSDSCKPISYLEDNFRPKSHIHLLLFWFCASCIGFVLAHTHSFAWNNPQALISPLDYLFAFGLEFVQCLWHFPLTRNERRFDRHRSVPKTVWSSARKTHFWQFADDEKILQWAQVVLCAHTHVTIACQTFRHVKWNVMYVCECVCANMPIYSISASVNRKRKNNWKYLELLLLIHLISFASLLKAPATLTCHRFGMKHYFHSQNQLNPDG